LFSSSNQQDSKDDLLAGTPNLKNLHSGLSQTEAERRLKEYGFNEVTERKPNPVIGFVKKFWGLAAWMLEIIIVLSLFMQNYVDVYIVLGLLVFNAVLGFEEEQRASGAVEALKEKLRVNARVLRDSVWKILPARELAPGDVVRIRSGDFIPADITLATGSLEIDQSALTGESLTVEKKPGDLLYSGSIVKKGESNGVVATTGAKTYFGRTTQLVQLARPKLHIEKVISNVIKWLLVIVSLLIAVALVFSFLRGFTVLDVLPIVLVLLLSAIPVALPAMFTVSMAIGAMELSKKGVLVTRLSAAEDAATMNILCADKTGTITMNKLSIAKIFPVNGFAENDVVFYGALASQEANQDPIDLAFLNAAKQRQLPIAEFAQTQFTPFDAQTRRTQATVQKGSEEFTVTKGAVKTLVEACKINEAAIKDLESQTYDYAAKGYRTLAVAKTDMEGQSQMVGIVALYDMPRPDSKQLIHELQDLGISVKMLTGDALPIAEEIAKNVELGGNVMSASDLKACIKEDPLEAEEQAEKSDGFAEVFPEDKYTIVKSLQVRNRIVGMTGDGVNDAPALRQAEVGIAVSNATDVAKSAASVVLVNEGLTSIVDLVKNGRVIYERITAWILNKIVRTLQIALFVVLAFLVTGSYVVTAYTVILLFFLTDFVKISLSTDNFKWSQKPDTWKIGGAVKASATLGVIVTLESFLLLYMVLAWFGVSLNDPALYTFTFEILFYSATLIIFNVRERRFFWSSMPSKILLVSNIISIAIATIIVTTGIPGLTPVNIGQTLIILSLSALFTFVVNDLVKVALVKAGIHW
jgi:H+-transporting ATPase